VFQGNVPDPRAQRPMGDSSQPGEWVLPPDGQSRRRFLRNALIGSAAAAAVMGGGAVVAASPLGPRILKRITPAGAGVSPQEQSGLCITDTNEPFTPQTCFRVVNGGQSTNPGAFWLFFTVHGVAPNDYRASVTQSLDGGGTQLALTTSSSPFETTPSSAVHLTLSSSPLPNCPTTSPAGAPSDSLPVAISAGDFAGVSMDVQIAVKLKWNGGDPGAETVTFTAQLTDTSGATIFAHAAGSIQTPCPM
jgi:hypothetical protein